MRLKVKNTTGATLTKKTKLKIDKIRGATSVEVIKVKKGPTTKNMFRPTPRILRTAATSTKENPKTTLQKQLRRRIFQ
jgi:hypothetical protein